MSDQAGPVRRVLLLAHTGREDAREVARAFVKALSSNDIRVRALPAEAADLGLDPDLLEIAHDESEAAADCELAIVIGGDGTILRAAEITHSHGTPLLGVNLGHVGFLAESEPDAVESTIGAIVERRYTSEERLTIDVSVFRDGELVTSTFALNEASVEKAARERMLEVVVEIDGRPLSRFGCDGVVCATPTGSTAYNFSAGGPVVWPSVEALLLVPDQRPRPVRPAPGRRAVVDAGRRGAGAHRGRRRAVVRRTPHGRPAAGRPDRGTPRGSAGRASCGSTRRRSPTGWSRSSGCPSRAGAARPTFARTAMLEEIRIGSLGVIESSTLELGPGLTVITGETGAGKTMLVTALGLLLGGRADTGTVRTGAKAARVEGVWQVGDLPAFAATIEEAGGTVEDDRVVLARNVSAEGRSRAFAGGASVPVSVLAGLAEPLVAVHGQSDQHRLLAPRAQRDALDSFAGERVAKPLARYVALRARLLEVEAELTDVTRAARERAREADLLRFGLDEIAAVEPLPGEDVELAAEEARLGYADTLRAAAERAREALSSDQDTPDALAATAEARTALESVREHDTEAGELADRLAELTYLLSDLAADVASYASGARHRPLAARPRVGAAGVAHGAHPQVRRHDRRGARLGRAVGGAAPRPRRHRRPDRAAARGGRHAARRPRGRGHRADRRPRQGRHPAGRRRSPTS